MKTLNGRGDASARTGTRSPEDIAREAEENIGRYLELVRRIYERLAADPEAYARFRTLTGSEYSPTIQSKRSKPT